MKWVNHAKLLNQNDRSHQRPTKLMVELQNQDATLLVLDPSGPAETIRPKAFRPPGDWAKCREDAFHHIIGPLAGDWFQCFRIAQIPFGFFSRRQIYLRSSRR